MTFNKMAKRLLALGLTATMAFSLSACSTKNNGSAETTGSTTATTETPAADTTEAAEATDTTQAQDNTTTEAAATGFDPLGAYEQTVTCTLGRSTVQNPKLPDGASYEDNAYMSWAKDRLNVQLTNAFEAMGGEDYDRQVSLAIASGDLPDIMIVSRDTMDEMVENELIADLTDSYNNFASPVIKDIYDSFENRALGAATYDGKLMALPAVSGDGAPAMVWIRQDWLDKLGLAIDTDGNSRITRDEMEGVAKAFIEKDPGGSGNPVGIALNYAMDGGYNFGIVSVAGSFGAHPKRWLQAPDGSIFNSSTSPEMKETLGYFADLFKQGLLDPQFGTRTWEDITALMTNGQNGITFGVWHIPDWLLSNVKSMDPEANYSAFALEDANGKINVAHGSSAYSFVVVRNGYEYPEVAVKLINLFHDERKKSKTLAQDAPEVAQYESTGVDGSTRPLAIEVNRSDALLYEFREIEKCVNGQITEDQLPTLEAKTMVAHIRRYIENPKTTDPIDWSRYHSRMKGIKLIDTMTNDDAFAWVSPLFLGNTETMKSNGANLNKLEEETFIKIITGALSIDQFDKFVTDWKAQGGDQIAQELADRLK